MLILFNLICLQSWYAINMDSQSISLPSYEFQEGGQFNISIHNAAADLLYIGLCTTDEFRKINTLSNLDDQLCFQSNKVVDISQKVPINSSTGSFQGNISIPGFYRTVFYTCGQTFSKYDVEVIFKNPLSNLSADVQPCLYSKPIIISLASILIILWTINWIKNFTVKNILHIFITFSLLLNYILLYIQYFEIRFKDHSDEQTPLTPVKISLLIASRFFLFSILLMASKGWQIISETITKLQIFICIILSLITSSLQTVLESFILFDFEIPILLLTVFFTALYLRELISSVGQALLNVVAHLFVISKLGIDSSTTPIYYKSKMFRALSISVITYFILISIEMIVQDIVIVPFWCSDIFKDALNLSVFITIMWFFRLQNPQTKDYIMLDSSQCDNDEPITINKRDLRNLSTKSPIFKTGSRKWEFGDALPSQPLVLKNPTVKKKEDNSNNNQIDDIHEELL